MEVFRKVKVRKGGDIIVNAEILMDDEGVAWYREEGGEIEPNEDIWYLRGCSSCKHCVYFGKTRNAIYQVKPLPANTCKCKLLDNKYPDCDITFKSASCTNKHMVCNFYLDDTHYADDNVHEFIDIKNSCINKKIASIQGFSFKGNQAPFDFQVKIEEWKDLSFVKLDENGIPLVRMFHPVMWNEFLINGKIEKGVNAYIEGHNITDEATKKEISQIYRGNWVEQSMSLSGRVFSFAKMWFI